MLAMVLFPFLVFIIGFFADHQQIVPPDRAQQVRAIAGPAVTNISQLLFTELTKAIQEQGSVHAMDFCSKEAQRMTREVNDQFPDLTIKRTSLQYRNAKNAPDVYEREALEYFARALKARREMPSDYVQYVKSKQEYRYYRPLKIGTGCLMCHGDPKTMEPDILALLKKYYPNDKAVGYKDGDFRGLIRVSVPASQIR